VEFPTRSQVRLLVQLGLTIVLTPTALAVLIGSVGTPNLQKIAAGWMGVILGYWLK
jgi:hypothetical protein